MRHGRARPGHPRLYACDGQDVDARHKAGHDAPYIKRILARAVPAWLMFANTKYCLYLSQLRFSSWRRRLAADRQPTEWRFHAQAVYVGGYRNSVLRHRVDEFAGLVAIRLH